MMYVLSLNWNTTDSILRLYKSLQENSSNEFVFVIVDNGSCTQEFHHLMNFFQNKDNVFIKREEINLGFACGNNRGIEIIKKMINNNNDDNPYLFFINSDIIINEKNWDKKVISELDKNNVGIVGCTYHPLKWDKFGKFYIQQKTEQSVESETVQGSLFTIKYTVLEIEYEKNKTYFDENFKFAHYEETDLQLRIMKLGFKCIWLDIDHIHDHNHSATKKNNFKLSDEIQNESDFKKNSEKNRQLLFSKHKDFFLRRG